MKKAKRILNKSIKIVFTPKKILFLTLVVGLIVGSYFFVLKDIPDATQIAKSNYPQSTKILDRNGKLLYTIYGNRNQSFVPLTKIPKHVQHATIAIEDKDFYHHGAIDIQGIARAAYSTLVKRDIQGGSTLTQQLVKSSLLTPEQTITRKVKEIILSYIVEAIYSKDKVLEMYLNQVPYGGTAYGVQAASELYFGKSVGSLTLAESAFIAALPQAPSVFSPFGSHPELGKKRQEEVLTKMREQGYITKKEEQEAKEAKLTFSQIQNKILAPHFVFYVKDLLVQKYGQRLVEEGGLTVKTTLDYSLQEFAEQAVASEVASLAKAHVTNGAAVVTNPASGEILAMVGSKNYFDAEHDGNVNVTIAKRQPGSSIKPINYAVGLIKGYTAATPFVDTKTCFPNQGGQTYCPQNYDFKFHGVVQMRQSLASSLNIPAVKMLKLNGLDAMIATSSAMGIETFTNPEKYGLSLTLGGAEVTMLDMAEAFGVFANSGYRSDIHSILKVTDKKGDILESYDPPKSPIFGKKVLPEGVAFIISDMLSDNSARSLAFGTNSPLQIGQYKIPVKTGTTNDYRDNWTIGYTPEYVVTVWVGNNDNSAMQGVVSGITGAAPIWHDIMQHLTEKNPPSQIKKPANVVGATICATSGLLPQPEGSPYRCPTRFEYFIKGTVPNKVDSGKMKFFIDTTNNSVVKEKTSDKVIESEEAVVMDPLGSTYCVTCAAPVKEEDNANKPQ